MKQINLVSIFKYHVSNNKKLHQEENDRPFQHNFEIWQNYSSVIFKLSNQILDNVIYGQTDKKNIFWDKRQKQSFW